MATKCPTWPHWKHAPVALALLRLAEWAAGGGGGGEDGRRVATFLGTAVPERELLNNAKAAVSSTATAGCGPPKTDLYKASARRSVGS